MTDNSAQKRKNILIVLAVLVTVVALGTLLRGFLSSSSLRFGLASLSMADANGDKWVLEPAKGQSFSRIKGSDKEPGPPLLIKTDVRIRRSIASIGLVVEGQAGEKYVGGARKNGRLQPPPRLAIVDEAGKTLASGAFKYG
ncbi:MAG: hypothetical protein ACYSWO_10660 [Planctomycetota bacterium]|jgi:hypothetical protein